jgi:hypothetical protein
MAKHEDTAYNKIISCYKNKEFRYFKHKENASGK